MKTHAGKNDFGKTDSGKSLSCVALFYIVEEEEVIQHVDRDLDEEE